MTTNMYSFKFSNFLVFLFIFQVIHLEFVPSNANDNLLATFETWVTKFGKVYKNYEEQLYRFGIFKNHFEYIEEFNKVGNRSYTLGINEFSDLTHTEFMTYFSGFKRDVKINSTSFRYNNKNASSSGIDWRKKGAVNKIKDQQSCGSCWAFAAVSTVESINQITNGKLISLSEQELVDCDFYALGCNGGSINGAYMFMMSIGGIVTEKKYPYKGVNNLCDINKIFPSSVSISGYENVPPNSEKLLMKAVQYQPVAVAIDANSSDFMHYKSGIYNGNCGFDLDHAVVVVGYGKVSHGGSNYWIIRNSWGTSWGEKGYIRMLKDVKWKQGMCGITLAASYPVM